MIADNLAKLLVLNSAFCLTVGKYDTLNFTPPLELEKYQTFEIDQYTVHVHKIRGFQMDNETVPELSFSSPASSPTRTHYASPSEGLWLDQSHKTIDLTQNEQVQSILSHQDDDGFVLATLSVPLLPAAAPVQHRALATSI